MSEVQQSPAVEGQEGAIDYFGGVDTPLVRFKSRVSLRSGWPSLKQTRSRRLQTTSSSGRKTWLVPAASRMRSTRRPARLPKWSRVSLASISPSR